MSYLLCTKTFRMNDKTIAFIRGRKYPIKTTDQDGKPWAFLLDSEVYDDHLMPWDEEVKAHFIRCIVPRKES